MILALPNRSGRRSLKRTPGQATTPTLATVKMAIRRDEKMSEELIQFEGLVIEILPDARYRVQLDAGYEGRGLHRGQDEEEPDQDSGWRSCDHRNVALRSGKGTAHFSPQR